MSSGSLWDDLSSLVEILLRLGLRLAGFAICCAFAYQAYQALRSAFLGINTGGSAPWQILNQHRHGSGPSRGGSCH